MTNFNFIESANVVLKNVGSDLRGGNKEYTSISRVLKDIQRKDMLKAGYGKVFEAVGLEAGGITPADFFAAVPEGMHGKDKKGNDFVGIWGWKVVERDKEGKATKKEAVLRKVTAWTPNKLFKVLAQSQELNK
jgi:hypothetical protein